MHLQLNNCILYIISRKKTVFNFSNFHTHDIYHLRKYAFSFKLLIAQREMSEDHLAILNSTHIFQGVELNVGLRIRVGRALRKRVFGYLRPATIIDRPSYHVCSEHSLLF